MSDSRAAPIGTDKGLKGTHPGDPHHTAKPSLLTPSALQPATAAAVAVARDSQEALLAHQDRWRGSPVPGSRQDLGTLEYLKHSCPPLCLGEGLWCHRAGRTPSTGASQGFLLTSGWMAAPSLLWHPPVVAREASLQFPISLTDCSQGWAWGSLPQLLPRRRWPGRCLWLS